MNTRTMLLATAFAAGFSGVANAAPNYNKIGHIIFIYMENHSFDQLFGYFPGANGLANASAVSKTQLDRDGSTLAKLPVTWGGFAPAGYSTAAGTGYNPAGKLTQADTDNLPNGPFTINAAVSAGGFAQPQSVTTRDMYHRFYNNQMQINGGLNNKFAAWADAGGIVMGNYYNPANFQQNATEPFWQLAKNYVLADNFFQSAFGGSYLNHQFLICSCANILTVADQAVRHTGISVVNADGVTLTTKSTSPASALSGPPQFVSDAQLTPLDPVNNVYYGVNTMQPPYIPSGNGIGLPQTSVNQTASTTVPPQTQTTIGDQLDGAGINWAWYAGGMNEAIRVGAYNGNGTTDAAQNIVPDFQAHHNPFNYYASLDPVAHPAYRAQHLRDGGLTGSNFIADIDSGALPPVSFYKPQGNLNEHPGYTGVTPGEQHVYNIITQHIMKNPAIWNDAVIVITYDENGGQWDHVAPPKGDAFGPGTRIPAIIVSPFAKKGSVDHTQYDTTSILRLIENRYGLTPLAGVTRRDTALQSNGFPAMGDLTNALNLN